MKSLRHRHGALSLETLETQAVFDGDVLADLRPDEKNRAKELIEDFMIAANGVSAKYLEQKGSPSLRRGLRAPQRRGGGVGVGPRPGGHPPPLAQAHPLAKVPPQRPPGGPPAVSRPLSPPRT